MRRLVPDTVAGRTLATMVLALAISQAFSLALYMTDRDTMVNLIGAAHVSDRIAALAHLIDNAPEFEQDEVVAFADEPSLHVTRTDMPLVAAARADNWQEEALRASLQEKIAHHGLRDFRLRFGDLSPETTALFGGGNSSALSATPKMLRISLKLKDDAWLNFAAVISQRETFWNFRFILSMLMLTVTVILFTAIVIHRINVPLRRFTRAAERLGANIDTPPLPLRGPREIREVTAAFNDMQERMRRLLDDRRQILAAVSHDLRTPITSLRLRAERVENPEERDKILATLQEMESMVGSVLVFAREDAVDEEARTVDLSALVRAICDDMADVDRPVEFTGPDRLVYDCRRVSLKRALTNIIDNAVKYGGRAVVSMQEGPDAVVIEIDDEGPGIDEAEMEKVFVPFYRIERSRPGGTGVGLGLAVARSIVAIHGGTVMLANRQGGGLRVTVSLPPPLPDSDGPAPAENRG